MNFMLSNTSEGLCDFSLRESLLLGGLEMSTGSAVQASDGTSGESSVERARSLLAEALEIIDALKMSPEIGAKLQDVITSLDDASRV